MEFLELIKVRGAGPSARDWSAATEACAEEV
jgi:hypothetical protein